MKVTKETVIGEVLDFDMETAQFFFEIGMHCLGCPMSRGESIADACAVHGTDADELVKKINAFLGKNTTKISAPSPQLLRDSAKLMPIIFPRFARTIF